MAIDCFIKVKVKVKVKHSMTKQGLFKYDMKITKTSHGFPKNIIPKGSEITSDRHKSYTSNEFENTKKMIDDRDRKITQLRGIVNSIKNSILNLKYCEEIICILN